MSDNTSDASIAQPSEPYQRKLYDFLSKVPVNGDEVPSGTPVFPYPYTSEALAKVIKNCKSDALFESLTNMKHRTLLEEWLTNRTTTCNLIITGCARAMGYGGEIILGRFDIRDQLLTKGLAHVWVDAESGALPEYGDIFRLYSPTPDHNGAPLNHMAVVLQMVGNDMHTVEGGQAGPSKGYDSIKRKVRTWKVHGMQGWVSMRALLAADKPSPYWLGGWWQVEEDPYETYWYYFAAGGKVTYCSHAPVSFRAPPASASLVGQVTMKGMFEGAIRWQSSDVTETLKLDGGTPLDRKYVMSGRTAKGAAIRMSRILGANKDL